MRNLHFRTVMNEERMDGGIARDKADALADKVRSAGGAIAPSHPTPPHLIASRCVAAAA